MFSFIAVGGLRLLFAPLGTDVAGGGAYFVRQAGMVKQRGGGGDLGCFLGCFLLLNFLGDFAPSGLVFITCSSVYCEQ